MKEKRAIRITVPILVPLTVLFVILKATGEIDWNWIWVFAPLWLPLSPFVVIFLLAALFVGAANIIESRQERRRTLNRTWPD